jgi:hypothetical protein
MTLVGTLLVSALIRPPGLAAPIEQSSSIAQASENQVYVFQGQSNSINLYGRVARLYGEHKVFPTIAATPRVDTVGTKSRLQVLYDFGIGNVDLSDIRIGDIPIESFDPIIRIHRDSLCDDLDIVSGLVAAESLSYVLEKDEAINLSSHENSNSATLEIYFPRGLVRFRANGVRELHNVGFITEYRAAGASAWDRVPAGWYKGAKVSADTFTQNVLYDYGGNGHDDNGTRWEVYTRTKNEQIETKIYVYRYGKEIGKFGPYTGESAPTTVTIDDMQYSQGAPRATVVEDLKTFVMYELIAPIPVPDNTVLVSASTGEPFVLSIRISPYTIASPRTGSALTLWNCRSSRPS